MINKDITRILTILSIYVSRKTKFIIPLDKLHAANKAQGAHLKLNINKKELQGLWPKEYQRALKFLDVSSEFLNHPLEQDPITNLLSIGITGTPFYKVCKNPESNPNMLSLVDASSEQETFLSLYFMAKKATPDLLSFLLNSGKLKIDWRPSTLTKDNISSKSEEISELLDKMLPAANDVVFTDITDYVLKESCGNLYALASSRTEEEKEELNKELMNKKMMISHEVGLRAILHSCISGKEGDFSFISEKVSRKEIMSEISKFLKGIPLNKLDDKDFMYLFCIAMFSKMVESRVQESSEYFDSLVNSYEKKIKELSSKVSHKKDTSELTSLKNVLEVKNKLLEKQASELLELQRKVKKLQKKEEELEVLKQYVEELESEELEQSTIEESDYFGIDLKEELMKELEGFKVSLIGGYPTFGDKLKQHIPQLEHLPLKNKECYPTESLKNCDIVLFTRAHISHMASGGALAEIESINIPLIRLPKNVNMDIVIPKILEDVRSLKSKGKLLSPQI
jgi:hypothetical protein